MPRLVPGNAATILAIGSKFPQIQVKLIEARLGLNQPIETQYLLFLKNVFASWPPYFGVSYAYYPYQVTDLIAIRLVWTILLIASSATLALIVAYVLAAASSFRRGGKLEFASLYSSIGLQSTPVFWIGWVLIFVFGVLFSLLPVTGNVDPTITSFGFNYVLSVLRHLILPVLALSGFFFGQTYLVLRGAVQQELQSDYILTAKARGLGRRRIAFGYTLRNSLLPLVSLTGYYISNLIGAVVLVEFVFGYPGVGDLVVDGVLDRDYPVLLGSLYFLTVAVLVGGLIGDFLLFRLDPRLRR